MGGSSWSDDYYADRRAQKQATNTPTFAHHAQVQRAVAQGNTNAVKAHPTLDVKGKTRESRDSAAHPNSRPIGVIFDETGSMGEHPRVLQGKLPGLMGTLLRKGYIQDPQILMGAVGDALCDRVPFQAGQFESGVEMDEDLTNIFLESNGGGNGGESYALPMYFFARHTVSDAWEKRQEKGFLFIIGDEPCHPRITRSEVLTIFGDTIERDIPVRDIITEVQERYHLFFIIPKHADRIKAHWQDLVGAENVLMLEDSQAICECIALAIGLCEGTVDLNDGQKHIQDNGASASIVRSVTSALGDLSKKTALARAGTGDLPARTGKAKGVKRL